MQYKESTIAAAAAAVPPQKMAARAPIAIGTRGTVGSLVRKEIDYFTKFELEAGFIESSRKPQMCAAAMASSSGGHDHSPTRPSFWPLIWKRKKRRSDGSSTRFLPNICSAVEVADSSRLSRIPASFSYRILKDDVNHMQV